MRTAWLIALAGCFRFDASTPPGSTDAPPPVIDTGADAATLAEISQALLEQWSGCLSFANFQASNMKVWGTLKAGTNDECQLCHSTGQEGFIATTSEQPFFDAITQRKLFLLQYFTVDFDAGPENAKIVINTASFTGVGTAQPPHADHPTFNPTNNAGMTALTDLYNRTIERKLASTCDAPRLVD